MIGWSARILGVVLFGIVGLAACGGDGCGQSAGGQTEPDDDRIIVDEAYRFRVEGQPGWVMLDHERVLGVNDDAAAGALMGPNHFGLVIVERVGEGVDGAALTQLLIAGGGPDAELVAQEETTFGGRPAVRSRARQTINGVTYEVARVVIVRDGWAWQLLVGGHEGSFEAALADAFFAAVTLLDGEVAPRASGVVVADASGPGWTLRSGVYENTAVGLRVAPPEGWRVALGEELRAMDPEAVVGLVSTDPDAYVSVAATPRAGRDEGAMWATLGEGPAAETLALASGAGAEPRDVRVLAAEEGALVERLRTLVATPTHWLRVDGWYVVGVRAEGRAAFGRALGGLAAIASAATPAAGDAPRAVEHVVEGAKVLRYGVYRDFERDVVWRAPEGAWRLFAGAAARSWDVNAEVFMDDPASGVRGMLVVAPQETPPVSALAFAEVVKRNLAAEGASARVTGEGALTLADGREARWVEGVAPAPDGTPLAQRFVLTATGEALVAVHTFVAPELLPGARAALDAPGRGIGAGAGEPFARRGRRVVSERLGWRLMLPSGAWTYADRTPEDLGTIGEVATWERDDAWVAVVAAVGDTGAGRGRAGMAARLLVREQFGIERAADAVEATTVAGAEGERSAWREGRRRIVALTASRPGQVVVLLTASEDERLAGEVAAGFALLE